MAKIAIVIVIVAVVASIGIAFSFYVDYAPNFIPVKAGDPVKVGPVEYIVHHIGEHNGDENTRPEHTFVQIEIIAENQGSEKTTISGGQFHILDEEDRKIQPVYGNFSENDLLYYLLEPGDPVTYTTQFDIPYDESKQYRIGILPTKEQSSRDIAIICVINC